MVGRLPGMLAGTSSLEMRLDGLGAPTDAFHGLCQHLLRDAEFFGPVAHLVVPPHADEAGVLRCALGLVI